jgi:hypothetical protein
LLFHAVKIRSKRKTTREQRSDGYLGMRRRCAAGGEAELGEAVLVHDPVGLGAAGRAARVEDESLLEPDHPLGVGRAADGLVRPRRLPEPVLRRPVRPPAAAGLAVPRHEEVPLPLPDLRHRCTSQEISSHRSSAGSKNNTAHVVVFFLLHCS